MLGVPTLGMKEHDLIDNNNPTDNNQRTRDKK